MDEKQFADCVEKYTDAVYRVAFHSCKNPADSEDITQNVLLKLYREPKEFESEEHLRRWLLRVAVNESKKLVCSAWFKRSVPLEEFAGALEFEAPEESSFVCGRSYELVEGESSAESSELEEAPAPEE